MPDPIWRVPELENGHGTPKNRFEVISWNLLFPRGEGGGGQKHLKKDLEGTLKDLKRTFLKGLCLQSCPNNMVRT